MNSNDIRTKILDLVWDLFNSDQDKVHAWMHTFNPQLCHTPYEMMYNGNEKKLLAFVQSRKASKCSDCDVNV